MRSSVFVGKYRLHTTAVTSALDFEDTDGKKRWVELFLMDGE